MHMCTGILWSKTLWKIPMAFVAYSQARKRRSVGKWGGWVCDGTNGCDSWNEPRLPTGRGNITSSKVSNHNHVHLIPWARCIFSSWPSTSLWLTPVSSQSSHKKGSHPALLGNASTKGSASSSQTEAGWAGKTTCWYRESKGKQRERDVKPDPSNNIRTDSDFPLYLVGQMIL